MDTFAQIMLSKFKVHQKTLRVGNKGYVKELCRYFESERFDVWVRMNILGRAKVDLKWRSVRREIIRKYRF